MEANNYFLKYLKNIVYSIATIIYLINLHLLNKELLSVNFSNPFELLKYRDYLPVNYPTYRSDGFMFRRSMRITSIRLTRTPHA